VGLKVWASLGMNRIMMLDLGCWFQMKLGLIINCSKLGLDS